VADKTLTATPTQIASNQDSPTGISVTNAVYWVNVGQTNTAPVGATLRADLDGSAAVVIAPAQRNPQYIAEYRGRLYWTNQGSPPNFTDSSVMSCARDACSPSLLADKQAGALGIAVDDSGVYWANSAGGAVMHCDPSAPTGCSPKAVANAQEPWAIGLDAKSIFWTDVGAGTVVRLAKP
jgi:hypothetical protein